MNKLFGYRLTRTVLTSLMLLSVLGNSLFAAGSVQTVYAAPNDISGRVVKDSEGNASITDTYDTNLENVHVYLYRDNGDDNPGGSDTLMGETLTSGGNYSFAGQPNGTYWVVVVSADINSLGSSVEQTYGGVGALVDTDAQSSTPATPRTTAGPAFGGRRMLVADGFTSDTKLLDNAEHVIRVVLDGSSAGHTNLDFGFGFQKGLPAGYSEYYVPTQITGTTFNADGTFGQMDSGIWDILYDLDNNTAIAGGMHYIISVGATTDSTTVYYDHWEDGYDFNPLNPSTADITNTLNKGEVQVYESASIPHNPRTTATYYDGRDRIFVAGGLATVTVSLFPQTPGSVYNVAFELLPVKPLQTYYMVPVGEGMTNNGQYDFSQTFLTIQSAADNNTVTVEDPSEPGVPNLTVVLDRGEVLDVRHTAPGTIVQGTYPIQVQMISGYYAVGAFSEADGVTIFPRTLWDDEYYAPVESAGDGATDGDAPEDYATELYIYNPTSSTLPLYWEDINPATGTLRSGTYNLAANSSTTYAAMTAHFVPIGSAAYLKSTNGQKFWAIGQSGVTTNNVTTATAVGGDNHTNFDSGYSLVPGYLLRRDYYLAWAPGDSAADPSTTNASALYVTAVEDGTEVFVDFNADGVPDATDFDNADNDNNPSTGTETSYILSRLESIYIQDPSSTYSLTGAHLWSNGATAAVWAPYPRTANYNTPSLDAGYSALPIPLEWMDAALGVLKSVDAPTHRPVVGETATFTLAIPAYQAVNDVIATDTLPIGWNFSSGTSTVSVTKNGVTTSSTTNPATSGNGTTVRQILTWNIATMLGSGLEDLNPNDVIVIRFTAVTNNSVVTGYNQNDTEVCGTRTLSGFTQNFCAEDKLAVYVVPLSIDKDTTTPTANAGGTATYTIRLKNTHTTNIDLTGMTVSDNLPSGFTYASLVSAVLTEGAGGNTGDSSRTATTNPVVGATSLTWGTWTLGQQDELLITFTVNISGTIAAGTYDNTATTRATSGATTFTITDVGETSDDLGTPLLQDPEPDEDVTIGLTLSGKAWLDNGAGGGTAGDGIRNGTEAGQPGMVVYLYDSSGTNILQTDLTDASGNYSFGGLASNTAYIVEFGTPLTGYSVTTQGTPSVTPPLTNVTDANDSDISMTTRRISVPLATASAANVDGGFVPRASIGDRIWFDDDGDGVQDVTEIGIAGVRVFVDINTNGVYDAGDLLDTTDANGQYLIENLAAGTYRVIVTAADLPGMIQTGDPDATFNNEHTLTVTAPGVYLDVDFGYRTAGLDITKTSNIPGSVNPGGTINYTINVTNNTAIQQTGIAISDPQPNGSTYVSQSTQVTGRIKKTYLDDFSTQSYSNTYLGSIPWSTSWVESEAPADVTTGRVFINGSGQLQLQDFDGFNITRNADLSGSTSVVLTLDWQQLNGDETVNVQLYNGTTWNTVGTTAAGSGTINYTLAAGYRIANGGIRFVTATGNWNGAGENVVIDNVRFTFSPIISMTKDNIPNGTYLDLKGISQPNTLTVAEDGFALDAGQSMTVTYSVTVNNPVAQSSIVNTASVESAQQTTPRTASVSDTVLFATISDFVWNDLDADGVQDGSSEVGLTGVRVYIDSNGNDAYDTGEPNSTTNTSGIYSITTGLAAGTYSVRVDTTTLPAGFNETYDLDGVGTLNEASVALTAGQNRTDVDFGYRGIGSISNYVWNDLNANGVQDPGEAGIDGATVNLRDSMGNSILQTTTTAGGGLYTFTAVPGSYIVEFVTPSSYIHSPQDQGGDDTKDSDASTGTGHTVTVTLAAGDTNTTVDAGFYQNATLGDYVWLDRDNDGIQDSDEPGIRGATVNLLDTTGNTTIQTVTTGVNGAYSFTNVVPGSYIVEFPLVPGTSSPNRNQGGDAAKDSDADPSTHRTGTITVTSGQTNTTIDAGFYTLRLDLGDLPDTYITYFSPGPAHIVFPDANSDNQPETAAGVPAVWLGTIVDVESNGQPDVNAMGDDAATTDDEDGLVLAASGWLPNGSSTATVTVNGSASGTTVYFGLWIDWDNNGTLETFYNGSALTGSPTQVPVTVSVPAGYVANARVYMRLRADDAPLTSADFEGTRINGEVEDYWYQFDGGGTMTPVTLSYFKSLRSGNNVNFSWSTATETGNVGFNLYVKSGKKMVQINNQLIPSKVIDSLERQDYFLSVQVSGNTFYIEDVSVLGETEMHGPFQIGKAYGAQLTAEKINLAIIMDEHADNSAEYQDELEQQIIVPAAARQPVVKVVKPTATIKPSKTPRPTATIKPTKTPGTKFTSTPTATYTPTATVEPTATFEPTATYEPSATYEPTATDEFSETAEPTATDEPSATFEPTATDESTATSEPTATLEPTATTTATLEPSATYTPSATIEPTATTVQYATPIHVDPASLQLTTTLNLKVRKTGIYRVSYEMLRDAGLDLVGVPVSKITLINRDMMMPVYVYVPGQAETFGPGGFIEFYGEALDTIYTDTNIYTVQVSSAPVSQIHSMNAEPGPESVSPASFTETLVVNNQRKYSASSPGADAWYDTAMMAYTTSKSWSFPVQVTGLFDPSASNTLELVIWGMTEVPQNPDHHLQVAVNGISVSNENFDGMVERNLKITLPAGVLREGANTLQLTLPGDTGAQYDIVYLDKLSLTYQRLFQAQDGRLTFKTSSEKLVITNLPSANVVVYRMKYGGLMRLENVDVQAVGSTFTAKFVGTNQTETYVVTTSDALYIPAMDAVRMKADLNHSAEYLIIAHPDFIDGIQPLVQARKAQGLTVNVVDVNDLYIQYTNGIFDPQAIHKHIAYAAQNLGTRYVLLVGGDTYDYRNYLGRNSISFIPSLYVATGPEAKFVPADPLYADLNSDNVPDLSIGRFPVRTTAELSMVINKTLAYASKSYGRTAVFASDLNDGIVSYKDVSNGLAAGMPTGWTAENIHLDDLSVASARTQLLAAMNRGTALVTFTGHSGPASWTFSNLFNTNDAAALTNSGRPFVVVQWGCWNTYYVDPVNNFLVQKFMFSGDRGAATVLGASTLTDSESERLLGELLMPRLVSPGMSVGQAMLDAKHELAQTHPELLDVLLGWSLMGDPALVIEP